LSGHDASGSVSNRDEMFGASGMLGRDRRRRQRWAVLKVVGRQAVRVSQAHSRTGDASHRCCTTWGPLLVLLAAVIIRVVV
jgi:hypothetical protein